VGVLSRKIQRAFLFPELGLKKTISRTFLGRKRLLMKRHTTPNSSSLSVTVSTVAQGVVSPYWSIPLTCLTANTSYLGHIYQHPTPSKSTKFPPSHLLSSRHQSGMFHLEQVYWKLHSLSRLYKSRLFQQSLTINLTRRSSRRKSDPVFKADFHDRMADFRCLLKPAPGPTTTKTSEPRP
jgi:hypothetical protein